MKRKVAFLVPCAGLAACNTATKDAEIRRQLPGTWVADWNPSIEVEVRADGTCSSKFTVDLTNTETFAGCWQVSREAIILTVTNASRPEAVGTIETNGVVSIDAHRLAVLSAYDGTNLLTMHRR